MRRKRLLNRHYLTLVALILLGWLLAACGGATPTTAPVPTTAAAQAPTATIAPTVAPTTAAPSATTAAPVATTAVVPATTAVPTVIAVATTAVAKPQPPVGLNLGNTAPDFTAKTVTGEDIKLSQFRGKGVLVNFWATF
jgi:hypothetical protein